MRCNKTFHCCQPEKEENMSSACAKGKTFERIFPLLTVFSLFMSKSSCFETLWILSHLFVSTFEFFSLRQESFYLFLRTYITVAYLKSQNVFYKVLSGVVVGEMPYDQQQTQSYSLVPKNFATFPYLIFNLSCLRHSQIIENFLTQKNY